MDGTRLFRVIAHHLVSCNRLSCLSAISAIAGYRRGCSGGVGGRVVVVGNRFHGFRAIRRSRGFFLRRGCRLANTNAHRHTVNLSARLTGRTLRRDISCSRRSSVLHLTRLRFGATVFPRPAPRLAAIICVFVASLDRLRFGLTPPFGTRRRISTPRILPRGLDAAVKHLPFSSSAIYDANAALIAYLSCRTVRPSADGPGLRPPTSRGTRRVRILEVEVVPPRVGVTAAAVAAPAIGRVRRLPIRRRASPYRRAILAGRDARGRERARHRPGLIHSKRHGLGMYVPRDQRDTQYQAEKISHAAPKMAIKTSIPMMAMGPVSRPR